MSELKELLKYSGNIYKFGVVVDKLSMKILTAKMKQSGYLCKKPQLLLYTPMKFLFLTCFYI